MHVEKFKALAKSNLFILVLAILLRRRLPAPLVVVVFLVAAAVSPLDSSTSFLYRNSPLFQGRSQPCLCSLLPSSGDCYACRIARLQKIHHPFFTMRLLTTESGIEIPILFRFSFAVVYTYRRRKRKAHSHTTFSPSKIKK